MWNPQARPSEWFDVEASRDEHGQAHARVQMTKWSARDRIGYMNAAGQHVRTEGGRRVADVGAISLDHLSRTITKAEGFGDIEVPADRGPGVKRVPFDPRNPAHLEALSADVLEELIEYAERVQPSNNTRRNRAQGGTVDVDGDQPPASPVPDADAAPALAPAEPADGGVWAGDDDEDPFQA